MLPFTEVPDRYITKQKDNSYSGYYASKYGSFVVQNCKSVSEAKNILLQKIFAKVIYDIKNINKNTSSNAYEPFQDNVSEKNDKDDIYDSDDSFGFNVDRNSKYRFNPYTQTVKYKKNDNLSTDIVDEIEDYLSDQKEKKTKNCRKHCKSTDLNKDIGLAEIMKKNMLIYPSKDIYDIEDFISDDSEEYAENDVNFEKQRSVDSQLKNIISTNKNDTTTLFSKTHDDLKKHEFDKNSQNVIFDNNCNIDTPTKYTKTDNVPEISEKIILTNEMKGSFVPFKEYRKNMNKENFTKKMDIWLKDHHMCMYNNIHSYNTLFVTFLCIYISVDTKIRYM
ncbi:MAG: hypothetical protein EOP34_03710 [Rickettsiales bacterium]|nr:MAG: hypothetical protein EOP34_03710 [Rickettsiales bacterium]